MYRLVEILAGMLVMAGCERTPQMGRTSESDRSDSGKSGSRASCVPESSTALRVTNDSVGRFAIATATMGEVGASCAAADTVYESMCCYMATLVHLRQPGVTLQAEQAEKQDESHNSIVPGAAVRSFEVAGDSVRLADGGPLHESVAALARRFGAGYVDNPDYDDNDGPELFLCSMPNLSFRISGFGGDAPKQWPADTSARNARARVDAVVTQHPPPTWPAYCAQHAAALRRGG